jgi:uncharacterized protein
LVFRLVAHFQPFSRGKITTLNAEYQRSEKPRGMGWEQLVEGNRREFRRRRCIGRMVRLRLHLLAGIVLAFALCVPAFAADFTVPPAPTRYVTDNASALSGATQATVDAELKGYEKATGHQLIVWIGDTTGGVPLETWTGESAHQWHVGRRGKDDGAILFLFMRDHKVRIEVGYGLEGSLTDADSSRIIRDDIVPRMKANDPDGAVSSGVAAMLTTITPSYGGVTPPPAAENVAPPVVSGAVISLFGLFGTFMVFIALVVVMRIIGRIRYGYLVMRKGAPAAKKEMKGFAFWDSSGSGSSSSGSSDDSSSSDDDFSSGGGDFGGGGASGSW